MGTNSFVYEMVPIYMGGNNENERVASPESKGEWVYVQGKLVFFFLYFLLSH